MIVPWFLVYVAVHLSAYLAVGRRLPFLRHERGILLYHVVPAMIFGVWMLAAARGEPIERAVAEVAFVVALQGIYSLSFLELWSLTQGGYSLTILNHVEESGGEASSTELAGLAQVGAGKQADRIRALQGLRLVESRGERYALTASGRLVVMFLWSVVRLVNHKTLG